MLWNSTVGLKLMPNCNYIDAGKGTTRAAEDALELQVCDAPDYKYDTPPDDLST